MARMNWNRVSKKQLAERREREHQDWLRKREREKAEAAIKGQQGLLTPSVNHPQPFPPMPTQQMDPMPAPPFPQIKSITSQAELITPELAMKWLEGNTHNRPLTHTAVALYLTDMKAGRWKLDGEPIIFDWDGTLQDGQHRLWACIESKTPFWSVVTRGVDPASFDVIDTGKKRSASDLLGIEKYPDSSTLAATARIVIGYWTGEARHNHRHNNAETLRFVKDNPGLVEWVAKARQSPRIKKITSHLAAVTYVASHHYAPQAEAFLQSFKTGQNLNVGSPILVARNRIFNDRGLRSSELLELVIRAWNAYAEGRSMSKSVLVLDNPIPKIKGDPR